MWKLTSEETNKRNYTNHLTNSQCSQSMVKVDREGNKWWSFDNLMAMPHTRVMAANKISSLYALGLSKDDLTGHINGLKTILKSTDSEKYEKAFSLVLDFESKASNATDAVKQMSSLVCVYYTLNDEPIDSWDNVLQIKKMSLLELDLELHDFFLNHQMSAIEASIQHYNLISQIVSQPLKELLEVSA